MSSKFHVSNFNSLGWAWWVIQSGHSLYDTPVLPICAPWYSNFEKSRNWFLGICMKNVSVQFRRRYLILRPRKSKKRECCRHPRFTHLFPLKFEFLKMQKSVFRYMAYKEYFSTISKTISYFAFEKISKTWMSQIPCFYPLKSKFCKTLS